MAFTLASPQLNAENTGALHLSAPLVGSYAIGGVGLPPPELGQFAIPGARLATPILDAAGDNLLRLPVPALTEAGPSAYTISVSGGAAARGTAPRSFILNGVPVTDPYVYVVTTTGGGAVSGVAPVSTLLHVSHDLYGRGGSKIGGTSAVATKWSVYVPSGGGRLGATSSGAGISAPVSTYSPVVKGDLAATLTTGSLAAAGGVANVMAATLPTGAFTSELLGGVSGSMDVVGTSATITLAEGTARLDARLPSTEFGSVGAAGSIGDLAATVPTGRFESYGTPTFVANCRMIGPSLKADAAGIVGSKASMAATLPRARFASDAVLGVRATLSSVLPSGDFNSTGYMRITATMNLVAQPALWLSSGDTRRVFVDTLVMNTRTTGLSKYQNYEFTSFAEMNGKYLAAGPDGLYLLDVLPTDDGVPIPAAVGTGQLDFQNEFNKRITDFYVAMRSDGDLELNIVTDEDVDVTYTLGTYNVSTLNQRRVITAKGARGKYWKFTVRNIDGCDFEIDSMNITAVPLSRRI